MVADPLISIIIPTHSRPELLRNRSIPSVLRQTYQNWELLIRGDGADESTQLVIDSFNDPRIKYKNLPRHSYANPREQWCWGGADALNDALDDTVGNYVTYLDDDDEFLPRHLETLSKMLMSGDYDLVYGRVYFETDNAWVVFGEPFDKTRLTRENLMAHCAVMYDRAKLGHFRNVPKGTDPGDWVMWKTMVAAGARVGYTEEIVAVHYVETAFRKYDTEFMVRIDQIRKMAAERSRLIEKTNGLEAELQHARSELQHARSETNQLAAELDDIRQSFGYKFMKFYARIIDALLPEGTTRGELKKTTVASLHVLTEQGVASLSRQIIEKIKRREFTIIDPAKKRPTKAAQSPSIPSTREFNDDTLQRELQLFLSKNEFVEVPSDKNPRVSIVIVTYNKAHYAYRCLRCLLDDALPPFELIVVDNASSDKTVGLLRNVRNASVIMNSSNQYFARANNQGASSAKGEYLLFLNQDAFIHKGCVSSLMRTLDSSRDIGAVGAKLVARDGKLLEAGSIVWRDGSCLGYGRGDDPGKPEYCYVRDVDYSSAACLMVRREAFHDVGGFDENFIPAYYEDTDLCMRLWERGLRVVYQPLAVVTHLEFSSSSLESATKLMARQQHAFVHKHESALLRKSVPAPANVLKARDKSDRSRILVVDDRVPKPIEGSGFPRMFSMLKAMASLGYRVTLLPSVDGTPNQPETEILTQMGIEVLWGTAGIREILNSRSNYYDVALISRPHNALFGIDLVRATNPSARIVYDAEALWYRRENLKRRLGFPSVDARFKSEDFEISLIQKADYVIAVSNLEKSILQDRLQDKQRVLLIGHTHTNSPTPTSFEDRRDLLFLGGFMSAQGGCGPNDDAAVYFAKTIFPHIKKKIPEIHFIIAGSDAPKSVWQLASESVSVLGYVQDLRELYAKARVFVAPIRFGAGAMWKVTEAMSLGLPCVLSTVAAEGLEIKDREEALIACDEGEFIEKTIQLYNDKALWADVRKRALDYIARNCDPIGMEEKLDHLLRQASRAVKR